MNIIVQINLSKEEPYIVGEDSAIAGFVRVNCPTGMMIKDIKIILHGRYKARLWKKLPRNPSHLFPFSNPEYYEITKQKQIYYRHGGVLIMGVESFHFNFDIDPGWYGSLEGTYGHIRYEIIAQITYPAAEADVYVKPISVLKHYDLNLHPVFAVPQDTHLETNCLLMLVRGKIRYKLRTPMRAYVPGQIIRYSLEANEKASSHIICHCVEFIKRIAYTFGQGKRASYESQVPLYSREIDDNNENEQIITDNILVPVTPPTFREHMVRVQYYIKVKAKVSEYSYRYKLRLPITIGTIPIRLEDPRLGVVPIRNPPTYRESGGNQIPFRDYDLDLEYRRVGFRPLYPVYRNNPEN